MTLTLFIFFKMKPWSIRDVTAGCALNVGLGRVVHCDLTPCVASLRRMIGFAHFSLCFSKITRMLRVWQRSHMAGKRPPQRISSASRETINSRNRTSPPPANTQVCVQPPGPTSCFHGAGEKKNTTGRNGRFLSRRNEWKVWTRSLSARQRSAVVWGIKWKYVF